MNRNFRTCIDASAGLLLLLAIGLAVLIDRTSNPNQNQPSAKNRLKVHLVSGLEQTATSTKLRLAVTPTKKELRGGEIVGWDDMGRLLNQLGSGYHFDVVESVRIAENPQILDKYDVLFLTCAPGGLELRGALADFVARGGTLYASDWRYDAVANSFPEMADRLIVGHGLAQDVIADVIEPGLRSRIGATIRLRFDLSAWRVAAFDRSRVRVLIEGNYRLEEFPRDNVGIASRGPLLVQFNHGKGSVIFTSFHNERQNSEMELELLRYLVFQLVNAAVDLEVSQFNERAGFQAADSNLLAAPKGMPETAKHYNHAKKGDLRFSLAFRNEGARFRVTLVSPDGNEFAWEGTSTLIADVPNAAPGRWTARITAVHIPYENFVYSVTFGAKRK
jgi:hypothetical protein